LKKTLIPHTKTNQTHTHTSTMFKHLTIVVLLAFLACAFGGASKASVKAVAPAKSEENGLKKFVDAVRDSVKGQASIHD